VSKTNKLETREDHRSGVTKERREIYRGNGRKKKGKSGRK